MDCINPNILDEGNQMELIQDNEDDMLKIVRCNNCRKINTLWNDKNV